MSQSPLSVILEMIMVVLSNTVNTLVKIFGLFFDFLRSLGGVSSAGSTGFFIAVAILALVLFFVGKFILKSGKTIIILFFIGAALLLLLFWF